MSDHKEHITQYSADIQRYVQGILSAREMHAMEKAALDDPFLADAIEGMQEAFADHNDENLVTGQLQQLQQQFQTRTAPTAKVVAIKPFRYWQAAAAAVGVIVTGVWIYSLKSDSSASENNIPVVAKTEEVRTRQQAPATTLSNDKETFLSTDSTPAKGATANKTNHNNSPTSGYLDVDNVTSANNKTVERVPAPPSPSSALSRSKTDTVKQDDVSNWGAAKQADKNAAVAKQETMAPSAASAAVPEYKKAQKESANNNVYPDRDRETELITIKKSDSPKKMYGFNNNLTGVIKGQVTDQNNNPIANAYVQVTKNNNNIITDKSGFFKLPVSDSVVDVAVNVTGYGTQNFRLQNNAGINQLQLQPANAALDAVVIPPTKGRKLAALSSKLPNNIVYDAEPSGGWTAFDQYLEKNKKIPAGGIGQVIVSFEVNKKGILSGFKIEQSLSKVYDDEAIRLIMQGPSWKLLKKGRKARITVMVRF